MQLLHQSRLNAGAAKKPEAAAFLEDLQRGNQLYAAPFGSNDDWYWLYAAVQAGTHPHYTHALRNLPLPNMEDL